MTSSFVESVENSIRSKGNPCVVGIDPNVNLMPDCFLQEIIQPGSVIQADKAESILYEFGKLIIDSVSAIVPVVKFQSAYYELYGSHGIKALERTVAYAKEKKLLVILDIKRGDIGATSEAYAQAYLGETGFSQGKVDCITLNPYLGPDSLEPFIHTAVKNQKGVFVCVRTSNPSAGFLQDLSANGKPLYLHVGELVAGWAEIHPGESKYSLIGAVAGGTYKNEIEIIRKLLPSSLLLVPGIGAQKGSLEAVKSAFDNEGMGALISSSRSINYPSGQFDNISQFLAGVRGATEKFIEVVNNCRRM